tara:strand:+ start:1462 stop:2001 length:540 start_codon:yes stop_codon:yes gene_type:complete
MSKVLSIDFQGRERVNKVIADLQATEKQALLAAVKTLNKTALWLRTHATKDISKERRIPQKVIRERIDMLRAARNNLQARVRANLRGIHPGKIGTLRQTRKGAQVKSFLFEGAFVAQMPSAKVPGIYKRKGKERVPLRTKYIKLEPEASEIIKNILDSRINKRFEEIFRQELNFLLKKR